MFRMPAEWEPHAATWLSWPHKKESWPGNFDPIPAVWAELVRTLAPFERVEILAGGKQVMASAKKLVGKIPGVRLHDIPTNDAWMRDHGPTFVLSTEEDQPPAIVDWSYNAWGGKYPPYQLDDDVPRQLAELLELHRFEPGVVMEGGAIDVNGLGTLMTTEQCLLNENRNAGMDRDGIEHYLTDYCGARHFIWLGEGIVGDDTDGHIDELARFVDPRTIVAAVEEDPSDDNYKPLQDNLARLKTATDQDGQPLNIVQLPMPRAKFYDGSRLPASYCNFYIANGVVVVPQFDDPADLVVLEILGGLFPTRKIRGIGALELVWGLGAFHCITQQQPAFDD